MPICKTCDHAASDHNWIVERVRGRCVLRRCECRKYVPLTVSPKPLNRFVGRLLYRRRR